MEAPECLSRDLDMHTFPQDSSENSPEEEAIEWLGEQALSFPSVEILLREQKEASQRELTERGKEKDYTLNEYGILVKKQGEQELVWVPESLVEQILQHYHGPAYVGHFGVDRIIRRITQRYIWKNLRRDCRPFVESRVHCNLVKLPRPDQPRGVTQAYWPLQRFELVVIDICTVSSKSQKGNDKVLVIIDIFTRYVMTIPIPKEDARTVANAFLKGWVYRFGAPERLLSDRGSVFLGDVITNLCTMVDTKKIFTTAYHPQTNGTVERFNRTLWAEIRSRNIGNVEEWDEYVPIAVLSYNNSVHSSTKVSPYEAMYGIPPTDFDRDMAMYYVVTEEKPPQK